MKALIILFIFSLSSFAQANCKDLKSTRKELAERKLNKENELQLIIDEQQNIIETLSNQPSELTINDYDLLQRKSEFLRQKSSILSVSYQATSKKLSEIGFEIEKECGFSYY